MAQTPVIGQDYLRAFHQRHPGITEAVLVRAGDHGMTAYRWLAGAVPAPGRVLDVACGSAPMRRVLAPGCAYAGIDRSPAELAAARAGGAGGLIRADATALPVSDGAFDAVVCSMALMIIEPLEDVLAEIRRVLRPGGLLAATVPAEPGASGPATALLGRIAVGAGPLPRSPNNAALADAGALLARHRLRLTSDGQRRFGFRLRTGADARLVLDSLYLPGMTPARKAALSRIASAAAIVRPTVPIPIRRLVAVAQ